MKKTAIVLISITLLVLIAWQSLKESYGVGVKSVRWLPREARNITYLKMRVTNTMAEFKIEQEAFEKWCVAQDMPLQELNPGE